MIEIRNLSFKYGKREPLFDDLSLQVDAGRIAGLLGKNGAGKSTLLRLVAGLLTPQSGSVCVDGFVPSQRNPLYLSEVCMIPEEFSLPSISIAAYIRAVAPLYPTFDRDKMAQLLGEFELQPQDRLHRLSYGQRKKFLIAFALASNCRLLLLDEPTNGLDIPSKSLFRRVLVGSISDEQLVVISTHQVKDIDTVIDALIVVDDGALVFEDDMAAIGQKYLFETTPLADANALYAEQSAAGYRVIRARSDEQEETTVDLELFFNAIIHHKIQMTK